MYVHIDEFMDEIQQTGREASRSVNPAFGYQAMNENVMRHMGRRESATALNPSRLAGSLQYQPRSLSGYET